MMSKKSVEFLLSLFFYASSFSLLHAVSRNLSNFPTPVNNQNACGRYHDHNICDPGGLLNHDQVLTNQLLYQLRTVRASTPCMCMGCTHDRRGRRKLVIGIAIARSIYIPRNYSNPGLYLQTMADAIRERWALGDCRGSENDVVLLYEYHTGQLVPSFGSLVKRRMGARCMERIDEQINIRMNYKFQNRLFIAVEYIKNSVRNPCCGRACALYLNENWYKMLAWVVGGVLIFSALTFFGRRVCSRNMYVRSRIRSTSGAYPPVGLFGTRPRCTRQSSGFGRDSGRNRSGLESDMELPPGAAAHVLYSTAAPPPYPGVGPMTVQMPPPYVGKPPAYDELENQLPPLQQPIQQPTTQSPPQGEEQRN